MGAEEDGLNMNRIFAKTNGSWWSELLYCLGRIGALNATKYK